MLNALAPQGVTASTTGALTKSSLSIGIEPNVHLDEKADYLTHLHRLRRINLGDDNSDSAGYGLYLMRVPVSIEPGDRTKKGFGAIVNVTMKHDFSPKFLQSTYRNLVINDLIDLLAPVVHELIRSGLAQDYNMRLDQILHRPPGVDAPSRSVSPGSAGFQDEGLASIEKKLNQFVSYNPINRTGSRTFAIAPSDVRRVFVAQNLLNLAFAAQQALDLGYQHFPDTNRVRAIDVRTYLRHELDSAYDLMEGRCQGQPALLQDSEYIENLTDQVACRKFEGPKGVGVDSDREFNEFHTVYEGFTHRLPGNLRYRPIGVLAWGIAIDSGLLNRQIREDMKDTKGADGYACPPEVDSLIFYRPQAEPETAAAFQDYIRAKWPMITFSLEPVTDQQNIDDAFTRRRDLQLSLAFALSNGRISFRQAIQYNRQLQYEAQAIALNQTVSSFAHGNDTFGWKFSPRFQTPPEESNMRAVTNLLLRGGPGPNYGINNSKIEPGIRELTAVVVMPSFVRSMRLDVSGDWYRLHDPTSGRSTPPGPSSRAGRSTRPATPSRSPASAASTAPRTSSGSGPSSTSSR